MSKAKSNTKVSIKTNTDVYEKNHAVILDAIMICLKEQGKFPTYERLAQMTNLHYETIRNHAKDFNWNDFLPKYRLYAPKLMENILSTARKNPSSQRLGAEILGMVTNGQQQTILVHNLNEVPKTDAAIQAMENYLDELHKQQKSGNGTNGSGGNGNGHN